MVELERHKKWSPSNIYGESEQWHITNTGIHNPSP